MRITRWEYEGTPEELRQIPALWPPTDVVEVDTASVDYSSGRLPQEIIDWLSNLSPSESGTKLLLAYLDRQREDGKVTMEIGKSTKSETGKARYLMLYKRGPRNVGAVVLVRPANAKLEFRLDADDVADHKGAAVARPELNGPYQVQLQLDSVDAVVEAEALTEKALEKAALEG